MDNESRPCHANPLGKCNGRHIDVPVSEALEERLITMAALSGMTKTEYARHIWEEAMFGRFELARIMARAGSELNRGNNR